VFKRLLVPLNRSSFAEQALGPAVSIASASKAILTLMLVHVPRPLAGTPDVAWHADEVPGEEAYLTEIAERITVTTGVATSHIVVTGDVVPSICDQAVREDADLIVMTSHGRTGLNRAWIGSDADGVIRKSAVPVLMIRPTSDRAERVSLADTLLTAARGDGFALKRILVPLDGSSLASEVLPAAAALSQCTRGSLVLLQVVQPVPAFTPEPGMAFGVAPPVPSLLGTQDVIAVAEESLTRIASDLSSKGCRRVETRVVVAPAAGRAIVDSAREEGVGLIAMSTHGRGVSRLLLGSVADSVLRATVVPILFQRPAAVVAAQLSEKTTSSLSLP
jgi:nucleotide-binding universal stress UspA family protein